MMPSKVIAEARTAGREVKCIRTADKLADPAYADAELLLADLNEPNVTTAAAEWGTRTGKPVIGFVSHVDTAAIAQARQAGIGRIISRSGFTAELPSILAKR